MVTLTREPDATAPKGPPRGDDLSSHAHRQLIGYIGLGLPIILVLVAGLLPTAHLPRWEVLGSISAYYYTGANAAFVGLLVALALFLFTYRGYDNDYRWADRTLSVIAGFAALGTAFFPTAAPLEVLEVTWWRPAMLFLHYGSAAILFASFAVFSLWLFRLSKGPGPMSSEKRRRNRVYLACGSIIIASMIWCLIAGLRQRPIFLPESIALIAFAASWLVKGQAYSTLSSAVRAMAPD
jgi:heme A synthase